VKFASGKEYKIPNEYTVEEVERLLELKQQEDEIKAKSVKAGTPEAEASLVQFWNNIFAQLEIIFSSLQPGVDVATIKAEVTHNEALEIIGFFNEYRALASDRNQSEQTEVKKKLKK
jgi:hypothetical protein